ncbi:MAG TPA: glycosyltransferase [Chitinophagaceae bacterium]|nr:glycosyltransferase [Chitinophagaceae bacterium]
MKLVFVISNDPKYDQRMRRICHSLQAEGYEITLMGTNLRSNNKPSSASYRQVQLNCFFRKGKLFYAEFHFRAFFRLMFLSFDAVCAVDLDAALPSLMASRLRNKQRIYDAHELFCELPEIIARPGIYKAWKWLERRCLPRFRHGYTVSDSISAEYNRLYGHRYITIRNISLLEDRPAGTNPIGQAYILYQGALNEGRGIEFLLPAMQYVPLPLVICGEGNFSAKARRIVQELNLQDKVLFRGMIEPSELYPYTHHATIGLNLGDGSGLNNYLSLNNKLFDYIHAGLPQVMMDFPEFRKVNEQFEVAVLVKDLQVQAIAEAINGLLDNKEHYHRLKSNCNQARFVLNWQEESKKLVEFYNQLFTKR